MNKGSTNESSMRFSLTVTAPNVGNSSGAADPGAGFKNPLPLEIHDLCQISKFTKNLLKIYILAVFKIAKKLHKNYRKNTQNISKCAAKRHIRIC